MDRAQKELLVADLNGVFSAVGVVVVTHYSGLSVAEMSDLRRRARDAGASFRVTKNRLTRRALDGTPVSGLAVLFDGPTAIAYSEDPIAAPKTVVDFARRNDKLKVIGGAMGATMLDEAAVRALAALPSLDELRAKLVGLVATPATRVAQVLGAPAGQIARVMAAYAEKEAA